MRSLVYVLVGVLAGCGPQTRNHGTGTGDDDGTSDANGSNGLGDGSACAASNRNDFVNSHIFEYPTYLMPSVLCVCTLSRQRGL